MDSEFVQYGVKGLLFAGGLVLVGKGVYRLYESYTEGMHTEPLSQACSVGMTLVGTGLCCSLAYSSLSNHQ